MASQSSLDASAKPFESSKEIQKAECDVIEEFNKGEFLSSAKYAKILLGLLEPIANAGVSALQKTERLNKTLSGKLSRENAIILKNAKTCQRLSREYTSYDKHVTDDTCPLKDCAEGEICREIYGLTLKHLKGKCTGPQTLRPGASAGLVLATSDDVERMFAASADLLKVVKVEKTPDSIKDFVSFALEISKQICLQFNRIDEITSESQIHAENLQLILTEKESWKAFNALQKKLQEMFPGHWQFVKPPKKVSRS